MSNKPVWPRPSSGLEQREVAAKAKINVTTLHRMEACGRNKVRSMGANIEAVVDVLRKAGVEMVDDPQGVRVITQARKPR